MSNKWVYSFSQNQSDGTAEMRNLLGGKGANLAEMCTIGLPVPPGFTITTDVCAQFYKNDRNYPDDLKSQVSAALQKIEDETGFKFGDTKNPLLVSVRSGARASMPGMMDTVLNLGLNDETVLGLAQSSGDSRFAYDSYRRFIQMYSNVVLGLDHDLFEETLHILKEEKGVAEDTELTADDLQMLIRDYKRIVAQEHTTPFPENVHEQLWGAIGAVFLSWHSNRAIVYRRLHDIPEEWGTAVNVQSMVFGNMGNDCATGVAFTRDPSTGENIFYGEFLINAQGEDVVAGIRTPQHLTIKGREKHGADTPSMEEAMPAVFNELCNVRDILEKHYRDMQDIEFTVQNKKLYMLQTRAGKRSVNAAFKIAVDMVAEKLIDKKTAIMRIDPKSLDQLLHPLLDPAASRDVIATGLPASPGAVSGEVVFNADDAERMAGEGHKIILVRIETSPEDIHGMHAALGILTTRGGMTSHAAVVARGMGRPCVSGAGDIDIDYQKKQFKVGDICVKEGDFITIDGLSGEVMKGKIATIQPKLGGDFATLMQWADEVRRLKVRTNADTPDDTKSARLFGAEGIGLCRTEHMFFEGERIIAMRQMILASDEKGRREALDKILPMQRQDFADIFEVMAGFPVTIRLLDPPLHEFLPREQSEFEDVANSIGVDVKFLRLRAQQLHESNPMLGHRGCRLLNTYPEICEMQARAIFEASLKAEEKTKKPVECEVMIPLVGIMEELELLKSVVIKVAKEIEGETGKKLKFKVGTMIELPRACIRAGEIAKLAEFFSFGTNDLTQTVFGFSRDDAGAFLNDYQARGILEHDPFATLDVDGVGEFIKIAAERGRKTRPDLKLGICGEHGGDPKSIRFCESVGLDYVSCSPFRVPIARLTAAQVALENQ